MSLGSSLSDLNTFTTVFDNRQMSYGTFAIEGDDGTGKLRGKASTVKMRPSATLFHRHVEGEESLGLSPLDVESGEVVWGAIDVDDATADDIAHVVRAIRDFDIPLVPCYSKSNKLHLYLFTSTPVPASTMIGCLKEWSTFFGFRPNVEIFPKQTESSKSRTPSWINLPYFGDTRWMIGDNLEGLPLPMFSDRVRRVRLEWEEHESILHDNPWYNAPPCIRWCATMRNLTSNSHCRNNMLFSASVFFAMQDMGDDEVADRVRELNNSFDEPIDEHRLETTVLQSMSKRTYFYRCSDSPYCNKDVCKRMEFGVNSKLASGLDYGDIEQYMEEPPIYIWNVSGHKLRFESELEIINQNKFRELVMRYVHVLPRKVNNDMWTRIVNKALAGRIIHHVDDMVGGFSKGSQFLTAVASFFHDRVPASDIRQLSLGRTWLDKNRGVFVFRADKLMSYVRVVKDFKEYSAMEMQGRLVDMGAVHKGRYWEIPVDSVPDIYGDDVASMEIDFRDVDDGRGKF